MSDSDKPINFNNDNKTDKQHESKDSQSETNNLKDGEDTMENTVLDRPCTPLESLEKSLKEMKLIRNGQASRRSLDEFLKKLEEETKGEE